MKQILILGTGCPKCEQLARNATLAVGQLGIEAEVTKVTKIDDIMKHGVMMTPGLVIDGQVKSVGKVPSAEDIRAMLGGGEGRA
ncbi:MAG: TM0996/MTH895 family glutaredoxin-like protein [Candidatus Eisenbacteria bacterium]|uniref:TM0996/MTH895 family glutaredoxin-like protein n=1 Tax=Eiseniibacteriota bacterium TaxID=2212470 RepID=A0A937X6F1_UNCEI|nr:TM0996/MTH895 family glutaredoxin-like protein [Candidatus Eisenbacteria bacterium]